MQLMDSLSRVERMAVSSVFDDRPSVWIVADQAHVIKEMESAAQAGGARVTRRWSLADAVIAMSDRPHGTLLMLDIAAKAALVEEQLLRHVERDATDLGRPVIVSFPVEAVDRVAAAVAAPFANLLCSPSVVERAAAIGFARMHFGVHFHETDDAVDARRLRQLAEEVGRIARVLSSFGEPGEIHHSGAVSDGLIGYRAGPVVPPAASDVKIRADDIRALLRLRRQRDYLFSGELFADPAWDMMLDLMAARIERLKVAVSSLCIAAAVPPTTALRWIRTLTDMGIFVRVADPTDGRRVFIELSDAAAKKILDYLGATKRAGVSLI